MSDENEICQKWLRTPEDERANAAVELSDSVEGHAQAVVWKKLHEDHPDVVQNILADVMTKLESFEGRNGSKFSTWVHAVAENNVYEEIRKRKRYRAVFDETIVVVADPDEESENRTREVVPTVPSDVEGTTAFAEFSDGLSDKDAELLDCKLAGFSSKEAAELTGTRVEAVDSRWARLKPRLGKQFHARATVKAGLRQLI
jgi:RNA polymerase sigma factor (sigma-70 family)